ncbi:Aldehyde dehydrogenase [Mycena venus]|uniref:Aldehyde dehydrogenase n=1 Tax=Mycena venus TaxID=2733690 RepID=A0A8H6Z1F9_9AGAR|nr:Aldehyde dehydrogenase [Mycena venus]
MVYEYMGTDSPSRGGPSKRSAYAGAGTPSWDGGSREGGNQITAILCAHDLLVVRLDCRPGYLRAHGYLEGAFSVLWSPSPPSLFHFHVVVRYRHGLLPFPFLLPSSPSFPPSSLLFLPLFSFLPTSPLPPSHKKFTGSTLVGRKVMAAAAFNPKNLTLELGGKSPNIIFEDEDLVQAVNWAAHGILEKGEPEHDVSMWAQSIVGHAAARAW